MKKSHLYYGIVFGLILNSCAKKLSSSDVDFVGKWWNEKNTFLTIESKGTGVYDYNDGSSTEKIQGNVKVDASTLSFSAGGSHKKEYSIDKRPYDEAGIMKMVLSGKTFKKQ